MTQDRQPERPVQAMCLTCMAVPSDMLDSSLWDDWARAHAQRKNHHVRVSYQRLADFRRVEL